LGELRHPLFHLQMHLELLFLVKNDEKRFDRMNILWYDYYSIKWKKNTPYKNYEEKPRSNKRRRRTNWKSK
jgi:hypothetical protein